MSSVAATGMAPSATTVSSMAQSIAASRWKGWSARALPAAMHAATPRTNSRRRRGPEKGGFIEDLPGIAQFPHDRTAVAVIAAERSAARNKLLVGNVLDVDGGL